jgi:hypothetical protein
MNLYPMWQLLLRNSKKELHTYRFKYTYGGPYQRNGDIYAVISVKGTIATYILDFGLEEIHGKKYDPTYLLNQKYPICEVLEINNGTLPNGVKEIISFNEGMECFMNQYDEKGKKHSTSGASSFEVRVNQNGMARLFPEEYHLHGTKVDKKQIDRILKLDKIKQIRESNL